MAKRSLCVFTALILVMLSVCNARADDRFALGELAQCKNLYSYSGTSRAYFYGCTQNTLYSAEVIPDRMTRYVTAPGQIRAVCHDDSCAYALYDGGKGSLGVLRMNMLGGTCDRVTITPGENASDRSFAVADNEIFMIMNGGVYACVKSYGFNGNSLYSYSLPQGTERLFTNGGHAYAKAYSGEIFRLSGGTKTKCAELENHTDFTDGGAGYILTSDKRLISLGESGYQKLSCDLAVRTSTELFTISGGVLSCRGYAVNADSAKLLCAVGDNAAALGRDCECVVFDFARKAEPNAPSCGGRLRIEDDIIVGLEPGITAAKAKESFPEIQRIFDENGGEITSGKLRTGCSAQTAGGRYAIALTGDVNSSGTVNTADIDELMSFLIGEQSLSPCRAKAADYDLNSTIDSADLVLTGKKSRQG